MKTLSEKNECVLCKSPFSTVLQPAEGRTFYAIPCSSCTSKVPIRAGDPVRIALRDALGLSGLSLAHALQEALVNCPCGGTFSHDAGGRCPECIAKIERESKYSTPHQVATIWNVEKLQKWQDKLFAYILEKLETREETLAQLIEKFESGEIDTEQYMNGIDTIQRREFAQICAIQAWTMMQDPESAFRAAEELGLVERYGTRIMVSIASALEMSTGLSVITTLSKEVENWDDPVKHELKRFLSKNGVG